MVLASVCSFFDFLSRQAQVGGDFHFRGATAIRFFQKWRVTIARHKLAATQKTYLIFFSKNAFSKTTFPILCGFMVDQEPIVYRKHKIARIFFKKPIDNAFCE